MPGTEEIMSLDDVQESVILRTMEGRIDRWNRSAEHLYGWLKDEVLGRVSHEILSTKFPKPLEEIEAELIKRGEWEGELIHLTRNGTPVIVKSRWIFDASKQPGMVVEVNARSNFSSAIPKAERKGGPAQDVKSNWVEPNKASHLDSLANLILTSGALFLVIGLLAYSQFGHNLVKALYEGNFSRIDEWVMEGKAITPLEDYYFTADESIVKFALSLLILVPLIVIFLKKPMGALLLTASVFLGSLLLFAVLEIFPSLIIPLKMDGLSMYYAYKAYYVPDDRLGWRRKPLSRIQITNFQQSHYSPIYRISAPPMPLDWQTDENGFRNSSVRNSYDIVVLGDSYMDFGRSEPDTFPKRLEKQLNGFTVLNLGSAGYGPIQYLEVLKQYGLAKNPKYALFSFYSGNDVADIRRYQDWRQGRSVPMYSMGNLTFWQGYFTMLRDLGNKLAKSGRVSAALFFDKIGVTGGYRRPEIVVVELGNNARHQMLFVDLNVTLSPEEISTLNDWLYLERLLAEFRDICLQHGIKPIAVHVPSATSIYAEHTTNESGTGWRGIREDQIAAKNNMEEAFIRLTQRLNVDLINLSPLFRDAAETGTMLFYPLDSHWNTEGRELAARHVAERLRQMRPTGASK